MMEKALNYVYTAFTRDQMNDEGEKERGRRRRKEEKKKRMNTRDLSYFFSRFDNGHRLVYTTIMSERE
jgi:hypothetical protein